MNVYFDKLFFLYNHLEITDINHNLLDLSEGLNDIIGKLLNYKKNNNKVFIIGNGGSAAIASHTANDLLRNCHIPAMTLSDSSVMTCLSNDFGYEHVYAEQLKLFIKENDLLIAISSSGNSPNIINAVDTARKNKCSVITFSGFKADNRLRQSGDWNIYVPSMQYGLVELLHQILLHYLTDFIRLAGEFDEFR